MTDIKKTSTRKKATAKTAAPTAVLSPTAPAATAKPATASTPLTRTVSAQERARMVQEAAYYRAEKRGFQGDPHDDWVAAEAEITAKFARDRIRVA